MNLHACEITGSPHPVSLQNKLCSQSINTAAVWFYSVCKVRRQGLWDSEMCVGFFVSPSTSVCCSLCWVGLCSHAYVSSIANRRGHVLTFQSANNTNEFWADLIIQDRMKMLAVKILWHMDILSAPCFLITLQAVSYFQLTYILKRRLLWD